MTFNKNEKTKSHKYRHSLEVELVTMPRVEVVEHDVEVVGRQYALARRVQVVLVVHVGRGTGRGARRRVGLLVVVRQLDARHPYGAAQVLLVEAVHALARAARGRCIFTSQVRNALGRRDED